MNATAAAAVSRATILRRDELVADLLKIVRDGRVIKDEQGRRVYGIHAFDTPSALPLAVVLPGSVREVSQVLRFCYESGLKVFPRGAGTSLVGGTVAAEDGIVLCLSLMDRVLEIDPFNRLARVEAGIVNAAVSAATAAVGLRYAPDPASRFSSTIGGNIATNAGGARAVRFGATDQHVLGLKIVLIDGEIIELGGGELEASGFDLVGMLTGSEGMLGVIVEAVLRVIPKPEGRGAIVLGFQSVSAAVSCAADLANTIELSAMEVFDRQVVSICEEFSSANLPCDCEAVLVMEFEGGPDEVVAVAKSISAAVQSYTPTSRQELFEEQHIDRVWRTLDAAFSALGRLGAVRCVDVAVPPVRLAGSMLHVGGIAARHGLRGASMCRVAEGIVRSVFLYDGADPEDVARVEQAMVEVAQMTSEVGGVLAGEHGIGIAKRELLRLQLLESDLMFQMRLKSTFDTEWLLNNGKVYPLADQIAHMAAT